MEDEQYLTEKHYLVCDKGVAPKQMKVTSQDFVTFSGDKAATELDTLKGNNFVCLGSVAFMAGAVAGIAVGICAMIPGPGWLVAAIIAAAILAAVAIGLIKCKAAASQRVWTNTSQKFAIQDHKTLTLSSIMVCPAEGGTITAKETVWEAWGSAALTNLGHVANFAFGFLAGRGAVGMVGGAAGATSAAGATGLRQTVTTFGREFGRQFANTARKELIEQFTFKGFKNASLFCKTMRGLGIGGAYYDQYSIWSSDKDVLEKLKDSGVSLVLGIFAAKGATLVCFPAGTKVHTPNGMQNIEDLYEDDLVLTYNETTKQQEYKPILTKHERFTQQMLSLELPTGEFVRVTPEHRFFCNDEWIEAGSLKAGDLLHLKGGDYTTVISIEVLPHYEKVYNFDIEDNENYYVTEDGILVHNGYGERQITQAEYDALRKKTPSRPIQKHVNEGVTLPMADPALPGLTIDKSLHADHIVSMDEISRMDGFGKLTKEQQITVLNNKGNFKGLSETANTSKGSKSYEEWTEYKKEGIKVDENFRQEMMKKAEEMRTTIQEQINNFLKDK
ncbi:Hint domain-containing protein [Chryseobacterium timonianum]|uniref:Hint domain-containing protein n=1 Tax=Chryseobacterium timonianum TaxID=1805473 RepID=UPI0009EEB8C0|nr:Hint domain-containing protein [Chryseobacterium timonianum]